MLIRRPDDIPSSEITDERLYLDRRRFIGKVALAGAGLAAAATVPGVLSACEARAPEQEPLGVHRLIHLTPARGF